MKCLPVKNKRLPRAIAVLSLLISPLMQAEIMHTQLEFYDFATGKHDIHTIRSEALETGVFRFTAEPVGEPGKTLVDDYRLCLNTAGTQGYFRVLGGTATTDVSNTEAPLLRFSQEQDLHLALMKLPNERRLVYFADTTVLWVVDNKIALQSSPDCKH